MLRAAAAKHPALGVLWRTWRGTYMISSLPQADAQLQQNTLVMLECYYVANVAEDHLPPNLPQADGAVLVADAAAVCSPFKQGSGTPGPPSATRTLPPGQ